MGRLLALSAAPYKRSVGDTVKVGEGGRVLVLGFDDLKIRLRYNLTRVPKALQLLGFC